MVKNSASLRSKLPRDRGKHRAAKPTPEVVVWLGAGAITLGMGAVLASGSGVANADSGGDSSSSAAASGSQTSVTSPTPKAIKSAKTGVNRKGAHSSEHDNANKHSSPLAATLNTDDLNSRAERYEVKAAEKSNQAARRHQDLVTARRTVDVAAFRPLGKRLQSDDARSTVAALVGPAVTPENAEAGQLAVVDTVSLGTNFGIDNEGFVISRDGKYVYGSSGIQWSVVKLNTHNNQLEGGLIRVDEYPYGLAISPDGKYLYAGSEDGALRTVDTSTDSMVGIPITSGIIDPRNLVVTGDGKKIYLSNYDGDFGVVDIEAAAGHALSTEAPSDAAGLHTVLSPDGSKLYMTTWSATQGTLISVWDTSSDALSAPWTSVYEGAARNLAISPDGTKLYAFGAADSGSSSSLLIVNSKTRVAEPPIPLDIRVGQFVLSPDGSRIYVTTTDTGSIVVLNAVTGERIGEPLDLGLYAGRPLISPDGRRLYVTSSDESDASIGTIVVVDTGGAQDNPSAGTAKYLPIAMYNGIEPTIKVSMGGGRALSVIVDTGSKGLVVPRSAVPVKAFRQASLNPANRVSGGYGADGGVFYTGVKVPTTVAVGNAATGDAQWPGQIITGDTYVVAVTSVLTYIEREQTWWQKLLNITPAPRKQYTTLQDYFDAASGGAEGVLGIGPDAPGEGPIVTAALPGSLADGVFISVDGNHSYIAFGDADDLGVSGASSTGAPTTAVRVSINNGPLQDVEATFDSGGLFGTIPRTIVPTNISPNSDQRLPAGTLIQVYNADGDLLYSHTVEAVTGGISGTNGPRVTSDHTMNTGIIPFGTASNGQLVGVYIDNRSGTGRIVTPTSLVPSF